MRFSRLLVWVALLFGFAAFGAGAEPAAGKIKTYSMVADPRYGRPTAEQAKAAWHEVDAALRAHGFVFSGEPATADAVITVRFMKRGYEIDYDERIPHSCYAWGAARVPVDQEYAKSERRRVMVERLIETGK